jgi:hypothetical protein
MTNTLKINHIYKHIDEPYYYRVLSVGRKFVKFQRVAKLTKGNLFIESAIINPDLCDRAKIDTFTALTEYFSPTIEKLEQHLTILQILD